MLMVRIEVKYDKLVIYSIINLSSTVLIRDSVIPQTDVPEVFRVELDMAK